MLREIKNDVAHYFVDEYGFRQGEYREWHGNGKMWEHCFYVNDERSGEYKLWNTCGELAEHGFYVNDDIFSFDKIPYPATELDRMYFKLKYGVPLLPDILIE
jgi:antitoxin component YwqK of YwqJK toxin-antitoxin module